MILSLLLTYVSAGSAPMVCEQIFDPVYCKGPAAGAPGLVCAWQPSDNKCKVTNMNKPEDACKLLSHNQAACDAKPTCHYEMYDGECKGRDMEYEHPEYEHGMIPASVPGAHPGYPAAGAGTGAQTGYPAAGAHTGYPAAGAATGAQTGYPATGAQTGYPAAGAATGAAASGNPPAAPNAPVTRPPIAPTAPMAPVAPRPTTRAPAPVTPQQQVTTGPRFCKALPEPQCFGPSTEPGKLCMWDAEDFECSEATKFDVEAVCKQFGRSPTDCDAHENCFWDQKDLECSEIEFGMGFRRPALTQVCSAFREVNQCASQSSCYWDTTSNNCVNVVQASNVCAVYTTPVLCGTNRLCQYRNGLCSLAAQAGGAGGLRKFNLQSAHEGTEPASSTTTTTTDYFVMFACGFSGSLLGLLFALGTQKLCQRNASQEDYRDIVLDVNSHRRQVV